MRYSDAVEACRSITLLALFLIPIPHAGNRQRISRPWCIWRFDEILFAHRRGRPRCSRSKRPLWSSPNTQEVGQHDSTRVKLLVLSSINGMFLYLFHLSSYKVYEHYIVFIMLIVQFFCGSQHRNTSANTVSNISGHLQLVLHQGTCGRVAPGDSTVNSTIFHLESPSLETKCMMPVEMPTQRCTKPSISNAPNIAAKNPCKLKWNKTQWHIPQTETHNNPPQQHKSLLLKLSFMGLTPKIPQWEVSETDWPQNPADHREPWAVFSSWRKTFDSTGPWSFLRRRIQMSSVGQRESCHFMKNA